jgi:peptidoglycan/LPS O-acetylase OafA/YrhL
MDRLATPHLDRRPGLDGLRGMAALVVVLHHLLLTLPWFADRVSFGQLGPKGKFKLSIHNLFEYTPLHVFYGGTEAVMIFFVLSGYVLINPVSRESIFSYARHRMLRLYAPIFIAVTMASGLVLLFPRKTQVGGSWWVNSHAIKFTSASYFKNIWVVDGNDWLDSSLWTMRYEIVFSLLVVVFAKFFFKKSFSIFTIAIFAISTLI